MCWFLRVFTQIFMVIMQIGSIFEYVNQKPVFGVLSSDSIFYAPVLGFFAFTGIPSSVSLYIHAVLVLVLVFLINMDGWYWKIQMVLNFLDDYGVFSFNL